uniref:Sulfotransfer_1 domain-containing protein n=1 Tax=Rhabditophanes sp. KR3021 TaxID=114890 RepID=A0AC35U411_9BILA
MLQKNAGEVASYESEIEHNPLPPFINFNADYRVAPNNKLVYCMITKNMCTIFGEVSCLLFNPETYLEKNISVTSVMYDDRTCQTAPAVLNNHSKLRKYLGGDEKNYKYYTVVREPIDRFLSAYTDKCFRERELLGRYEQCYGCGYDMECFIDETYKRALMYAAGTRPTPVNMEDYHFLPQNWKCFFGLEMEKYTFFDYTDKLKMYDKLDAFYKASGVGMKVREKIQRDLRTSFTLHKTSNSEARKIFENQLRNNRKLMAKLINLYYYDFIYFNYSVPILD